MKTIAMLLAVLVLVGLPGCSTAADAVAAARDADTAAAATAITKEQAQRIALEHAGFTADQVQYLHTEYDVDNGRAEFEVEFDQGRWEYTYEIDAQTGQILSSQRDD